jgi:hypothetical protein
MKKMVFTAQFLGLLIMLPLAVVLQANHARGSITFTDPAQRTECPAEKVNRANPMEETGLVFNRESFVSVKTF